MQRAARCSEQRVDLIDLIALRASTESVLLRNLRRSAVGIAGEYLAKMRLLSSKPLSIQGLCPMPGASICQDSFKNFRFVHLLGS
jgi:hypothetical protein